jgi:hypothetical protein
MSSPKFLVYLPLTRAPLSRPRHAPAAASLTPLCPCSYGGSTGWIGRMLVQQLQERGIHVVAAAARIEQREAVQAELDSVKVQPHSCFFCLSPSLPSPPLIAATAAESCDQCCGRDGSA